MTNALQKVIMPYIRDNFPKNTILLDQVKRNSDVTFMNDNFYAPIRTSRHGGIANLANDGNSLVSGRSSIGQASVAVKLLTGTFDISKLTIDATKTAKGAVESQLSFQAKTLTSDFAKDVNRQYFSDGFGIISQVAGSVGAATASLMLPDSGGTANDARLIDVYGTVNGDISPAEYIFPDQILGFGSAAGSGVGTVSSVTGTSVVLTAALPANIAGSQVVYRLDGSGTGAGTSEIQGMRVALSSSTGTSTYAGVARNTTGWTPQIDVVSEALTLSAMEKQYLFAKKYAQQGDRYAIFCNITLYKKYGDVLTSMRRVTNETDLLGGWTGLEFAAGAGKVGVFLDYDVPDGEVLIVNLDTWTVAQVSDMDWLENPSGGAMLRNASKITYQTAMVWFTNLLCVAPAANGRLTRKTA
ncbi:MAG: phage major capsid protein [Patescibacteria group bacterium]